MAIITTSGNFSFAVDGTPAGHCKKFEGGLCKADEVKQFGGPMHAAYKSQGNLSYDDVKFSLASAESGGFTDWVNAFLANTPASKTAISHACDAEFKSRAIMEMEGLWISEMKFATLDANSKDAFYNDFTCKVERAVYKKGDGNVVQGATGTKQRLWQCSNFKVEMGGLPCDYVIKAELPSVTEKFTMLRVGGMRQGSWVPGTVEYGNLKLTMPVAHGWDEWSALADATVIKGGLGTDSEMDGEISFYAPDMTKVLGSIQLFGCSLNALTKTGHEGGSEKIAECTADIAVNYCKIVISEKDM